MLKVSSGFEINSPLQKVSRHLNFQGSSTLPKVLGGSVMTLESCRGVDALEKVDSFEKWPCVVSMSDFWGVIILIASPLL